VTDSFHCVCDVCGADLSDADPREVRYAIRLPDHRELPFDICEEHRQSLFILVSDFLGRIPNSVNDYLNELLEGEEVSDS